MIRFDSIHVQGRSQVPKNVYTNMDGIPHLLEEKGVRLVGHK